MELVDEAIARSIRRGQASILAIQLRKLFGEGSKEACNRLADLSGEQLGDLGDLVIDRTPLADIEAWIVREIAPPMTDPTTLTIAAFQKHVSAKYEATDRARGTPATWLWFCEEFGELARALARKEDKANIEEEFADCVAWLCTLANINDVDLAAAVHRKYLSAAAKDGVK